MDPFVEELLARRFRAPQPIEDKVTSLADAVGKNVRPGDAVHLGQTHTRASVAWWEVLRRFHGTDPGFTLLGVQLTSPSSPLVHAGLARKLVTSWCGDSYMAPRPSPVYQRAWTEGVEFEHWSILSFTQRLAAAARGMPWATTRSLPASTTAEQNAPHAYRPLEDGLGLVAALVPDVSIFHAPAADAAGNVLMAPPLMENVHGALAARRGAVVTVERVVDPAFVREHASFTRIPASAVRAVVEAPMGGHPGGLYARDVPGVEGYGDDYAFWVDLREASEDPAAMDAWIKDWVLGCPTHRAYVEKLGPERVRTLRRRARPEAWREDLEAALPAAGLDAEAYSPIEMAIVAGARTLAERVRSDGHRVVLAGAGMANLAAWL